MEKLSLKEAAAQYEIPVSRLRTSIKRGILPASKAEKSNGYRICQKALEKALKEHVVLFRDGTSFVAFRSKELLVKWTARGSFDTNAAADQFEKMFRKTYGLPAQ